MVSSPCWSGSEPWLAPALPASWLSEQPACIPSAAPSASSSSPPSLQSETLVSESPRSSSRGGPGLTVGTVRGVSGSFGFLLRRREAAQTGWTGGGRPLLLLLCAARCYGVRLLLLGRLGGSGFHGNGGSGGDARGSGSDGRGDLRLVYRFPLFQGG